MEVGWYLRFPRGGRLVALVDKNALPQLENQLLTVSGWEMRIEEFADHIQAEFFLKPKTK